MFRHGKGAARACPHQGMFKTWMSVKDLPLISQTNPLTITTTTTTRICTWMSVQDPLLRSITSAKPGLCSARGTTEIKYLREECECEVSFLGWKIVSRKYQLTTDEEDQTVSLWVTDYFTHYSLYWPRKYMGLFSSFRII